MPAPNCYGMKKAACNPFGLQAAVLSSVPATLANARSGFYGFRLSSRLYRTAGQMGRKPQ